MTQRSNHAETRDQGDRGRFSARRKNEAVLRLLRGEELDALSRKLGVTAATLAAWRDRFLLAGRASLKSRAGDGYDDEVHGPQAKIGSLTMENELLRERYRAMQSGRPFRTQDVRTMSAQSSPASDRPYGIRRVCQEWDLARSTVAHVGRRRRRPIIAHDVCVVCGEAESRRSCSTHPQSIRTNSYLRSSS